MNKKEFETIADVFRIHRQRYEGRTDSVTQELIEDMADALEAVYPRTFNRAMFTAACNPPPAERPALAPPLAPLPAEGEL